MDTLTVGNIHGNIGIIDTLISNDIAASQVQVDGPMAAVDFSAQTIVSTEAFASKEIATKMLYLSQIQTNIDLDQNSYLINPKGGNLVISKGNLDILELSE